MRRRWTFSEQASVVHAASYLPRRIVTPVYEPLRANPSPSGPLTSHQSCRLALASLLRAPKDVQGPAAPTRTDQRCRALIFDEGASLKPAKTPHHDGLKTARKAALGSALPTPATHKLKPQTTAKRVLFGDITKGAANNATVRKADGGLDLQPTTQKRRAARSRSRRQRNPRSKSKSPSGTTRASRRPRPSRSLRRKRPRCGGASIATTRSPSRSLWEGSSTTTRSSRS